MSTTTSRMILMVMWTVAAGFWAGADEPKIDERKRTETEKALQSFADTWEIVTAKPVGVTKDARKLVFRKDLTYAALDKGGKELWAGTFDIDPTATPMVWDHRSNEAAKTGGDVLGIYLLEGDTLNVSCVAGSWKDKQWIGKPRPKDFSPQSADVMLELRRVKTNKQ